MRQSTKPTLATKNPSTADAKLRSSTLMAGEALLSPIKEEDNKEDELSTMLEVQGSIDNNKKLTIDDPMEPLSDQLKDFLKSCLDDTRNRLEEEKRE